MKIDNCEHNAWYVQYQHTLSVSVIITHVYHKPVDLSVRKIICAEKEISDNVTESNSVITEPIWRYLNNPLIQTRCEYILIACLHDGMASGKHIVSLHIVLHHQSSYKKSDKPVTTSSYHFIDKFVRWNKTSNKEQSKLINLSACHARRYKESMFTCNDEDNRQHWAW